MLRFLQFEKEVLNAFRETAIQEPTSKSPRKFPFTSSSLGIGKKTEKPAQTVKKKDDQIKLAAMTSKDSRSGSKGSRLLPVITRQKKPTKQEKNGQSQTPEAAANQMPESSASQTSSEGSLNNQKLKRIEEAKMKRKELLEGSMEKQKGKDDRVCLTY